MKVDLVFPEFFTWTWNYSYGMVEAAKELGYVNKVTNVSLCSESSVLDIGNTEADAILFFGGCEHAPRLFDSDKKIDLIESITVPKISVVVESFEFDSLDKTLFPDIGRHKLESIRNGRYFSHVLTSDENDIETLRESIPAVSSFWFPQCADIGMFRPLPSVDKSYASTFVGSLYPKRKAIAERFGSGGIFVQPIRAGKVHRIFDSRMWKKAARNVKRQVSGRRLIDDAYSKLISGSWHRRKGEETSLLNRIYNQSALNFNFPGPHKGHTSRVFEVLASGSVLVQPVPKSRPQSAALFTDLNEIVYYDEEKPDESLEKISAVMGDSALQENIRQAARHSIEEKHSCRVRLDEIIQTVFAKNTGKAPVP